MIGDLLKQHTLMKEVSGRLLEYGITVNIRHEGKVLAKVGAGTTPFMMGIVGHVEIVDMESAVKLADSLGILS